MLAQQICIYEQQPVVWF